MCRYCKQTYKEEKIISGTGRAVLSVWSLADDEGFSPFCCRGMFTVCPLSKVVGVWGHGPFCVQDLKALLSLLRGGEITTRVTLYITMDSCTCGGRAVWQTSLPLAIKHGRETIHVSAGWSMASFFFFFLSFLASPRSPWCTVMRCDLPSVHFTRWSLHIVFIFVCPYVASIWKYDNVTEAC